MQARGPSHVVPPAAASTYPPIPYDPISWTTPSYIRRFEVYIPFLTSLMEYTILISDGVYGEECAMECSLTSHLEKAKRRD